MIPRGELFNHHASVGVSDGAVDL